MKKINLLTLLMFFVYASSFAQEEAVKDLLSNYINAVNKLPTTKSNIEVTQYFHENYKNYTADLGLSGVVNRSASNLNEYTEQVEELISNNDYTLMLNVEKILYTNQKSRVGTIAALINFENKYENKIADKGTILLNIIASKVDGTWKIMHSNTTRISESKDVGQCTCNIYKKGETSLRYVAEVFYPSGLQIGQDYSSYRIASKNGKRYVISDNEDYTWNENNEIHLGATLIGKTEPEDVKEAIRLISETNFKDNCTKMIKI